MSSEINTKQISYEMLRLIQACRRAGHYNRALEEAISTHKSQWARDWESKNPLSGGGTFASMLPTERVSQGSLNVVDNSSAAVLVMTLMVVSAAIVICGGILPISIPLVSGQPMRQSFQYLLFCAVSAQHFSRIHANASSLPFCERLSCGLYHPQTLSKASYKAHTNRIVTRMISISPFLFNHGALMATDEGIS